jgi:hypothetical protein
MPLRNGFDILVASIARTNSWEVGKGSDAAVDGLRRVEVPWKAGRAFGGWFVALCHPPPFTLLVPGNVRCPLFLVAIPPAFPVPICQWSLAAWWRSRPTNFAIGYLGVGEIRQFR